MTGPSPKITGLLKAWRSGDSDALDELTPIVYDELRRLARHHLSKEREGHTLQTTGLVHEAYLRLVDVDIDWQDGVHFFSVASRMMRRILVDHAKAQRAAKRGGGRALPLDEELVDSGSRGWDVVDLDLALERLEKMAPRQVRALELRYFGGLRNDEVARVLDVSVSTARGDIRVGKAWLRRELSGGSAGS